jgi:class 3 adenylate cyclase
VRTFHYRWQWQLRSSAHALWPLVTDTNRFNRDVGVPHVERVAGPLPSGHPKTSSSPGRRRLRLVRFGIPLEWEEEPFEWTWPSRFGVMRRYSSGPVATMRVLVELAPSIDGGSMLTYQVWAEPRNALGLLAIPAQIGALSARRFERTIRHYDHLAQTPRETIAATTHVRFVPGGRERLGTLTDSLIAGGADPSLVSRLTATIEHDDDLAVSGFRPYALADRWHASRRKVLELCLHATRAGVLEFRWKLLCPLCRGSADGLTTLADVHPQAHCDSCHIDFTANLDRSVELTFRPSAAIRELDTYQFCVGGPQITPHIVAQQLLASNERRTLTIPLECGRYRVRIAGQPGGQLLSVGATGSERVVLRAANGWPEGEQAISLKPELLLENGTSSDQLFILERMAWTDQAATAAEVTALQVFRDLFATEALRPGEELSVGSVAIVFTDLKSSTQLYREIGDAVAFGRILSHFDVVKGCIADEGGAVVKTIGDAVMAVFTRPAPALRAMGRAQASLAAPPHGSPPLSLKVGIHYGPSIAVTQNDRLDYFGSTINVAARLEGQSSGGDVIVSDAVCRDPEVTAWLADQANELTVEPIEVSLKGFDRERFALWRIRRSVRQFTP